jgi:hypothetical protein
MVDLLASRVAAVAVGIHQDARFVEIHTSIITIEGSAYRLLGDQLLETVVANGSFFKSTLVVETGDTRFYFTALVCARLISPRVVIPSNDAVAFSPIVGVGHPATLATEVQLVAVEKVLDRISWSIHVISDGEERLKSSCCCEGPTAAATCLIYTVRDLVRGVPVDFSWHGRV